MITSHISMISKAGLHQLPFHTVGSTKIHLPTELKRAQKKTRGSNHEKNGGFPGNLETPKMAGLSQMDLMSLVPQFAILDRRFEGGFGKGH